MKNLNANLRPETGTPAGVALTFMGASTAELNKAAMVYVVPTGCRKAAGRELNGWTVVEVDIGADIAGLGVDALRGKAVRVVSNERDWLDMVGAVLHGAGATVSFYDMTEGAPWTAATVPQVAFAELSKRGVLRRVIGDGCKPWPQDAVETTPEDKTTGQTPDSLDTAVAGSFLSHVFPDATRHVFQTYTDNKAARKAKGEKRDDLARVRFGALADHAAELSDLLSQGAGVFVTVNEITGSGRVAANVSRTRNVLYADMDGTPLSRIDELGLKPHAIVESSPGRGQVYWRVDDLPLSQFEGLIRRLAVVLDADKNVATVAQVMRLPGSLHQKKTPHVVTWRDGGADRVYALGEFIEALEKLEAARGVIVTADGDKSQQGAGDTPAERLSQDHLTRALALIPNDDAFADRHDWQTMGHAVYGASGGETWGCELFENWTERGGHDPAGASEFWSGVKGSSVRSGAGFIRKHLERVASAGGADADSATTLLHDMRVAEARSEFSVIEEDGAESHPAKTAKPKAKSAQDILVEVGRQAELFHAADKTGYASIVTAGARETWRVRSQHFERWLIGQFYAATKQGPAEGAVKAALNTLDAIAVHDGLERAVHLRVANLGDKIYLDLASAGGHAVEIDASGWRLISDCDVRFYRSAAMSPLPEPARGGSLANLRRFINIQSDEHLALTCAWLCAVMRGLSPFPLLVLRGEQGSAKSTFAQILRALIDPNMHPLRNMPKDAQDLFIAAQNSHVLAFDNLSGVSQVLSDALCTLATGGAHAGRELYSNMNETVLSASRPVILNGIASLTDRADLADRAITLDLPFIGKGRRQTETELWAEFERQRPALLGALLDAVVVGLQRWGRVTADPDARLADFSRWGAACEVAFCDEGTFARAYAENREAAAVAGVTDDPVAVTLQQFMTGRTEWTGTATELLEKLDMMPGRSDRRTWPGCAKVLSERLRRAAPLLRRIGLDVADRRSKTKKVWIARWVEGALPDPDVRARAERDVPDGI